MQNTDLYLYLAPDTKINTKWITDINLEAEAIIFLE
jgi:hypothetical protein